jgi:hypothetical protein
MTKAKWQKVLQCASNIVDKTGVSDGNARIQAMLEQIRQMVEPVSMAEVEANLEADELRLLVENEPELEAELARVKARIKEILDRREAVLMAPRLGNGE